MNLLGNRESQKPWSYFWDIVSSSLLDLWPFSGSSVTGCSLKVPDFNPSSDNEIQFYVVFFWRALLL